MTMPYPLRGAEGDDQSGAQGGDPDLALRPTVPHGPDRLADHTAPAPSAPRARGARMSTVVWGMLLTALGTGIVARGLDLHFDTELALIIVLCLMGGALLIGSVVAVLRKG